MLKRRIILMLDSKLGISEDAGGGALAEASRAIRIAQVG